MFSITRIDWKLEEIKVENGKIRSRTGSISFRSSEEQDHAYSKIDTIDFSFPSVLVTFKGKTRAFQSVTINLNDMLIRSFDKVNNEWLEIGTLHKFDSYENALVLLDKFIQDFEVDNKYKGENNV